jgi:4-hydroxy-2-oxoheptanedioate aldolase
MAINHAKKRMLDGEPAIGAEVGLGAPLAAEMLSPLGYDFVLVDNQHGAWWEENTMQAFRAIGLGKAVPMARVRQNDFGLIGRLLDMGALGVVVPMVNTVEQAEAAAFACRFPPRGGRSGGPFGAGFHPPDYMSWTDDEVFVAIQIETAQAAAHAEEIMSVEGIDGCWIGPNDLSMSMGVDLSTEQGRMEHEAAIVGIIEACGRAGKIPGISTPDAARAQHWIDRGGLFLTAGDDGSWMLEGAQRTLRDLGR